MELRDAARILDTGTPEARRALAREARTPPEALYYLMGDADPAVRAAVAANPATPAQGYALLAEDAEETVRAALAKRLAALAPGLPAPQTDRLAQTAWSALARLAADTIEDISATIAEAVQDLPAAPRDLILALAADGRARVCEPVIRLSPLLTEDDLLGLVTAAPAAATLQAVARRPAISEAVADALVATGDRAAIGALLGNGTAAIRESTLDALVVQAAEHAAWQEPLVRRPALPPRAAIALASLVADHLLAPLAAREDLPAEAEAQIRAAVAARLAGVALPGETPADAAARACLLQRSRALDEEVLRRAAEGGDAPFVVAALATMGHVPRSAVDQAVGSRCAKTLAGLCRQAGLSAAAAEAVVALLAPGAPGAAQVAPPLVGDGELRWRIDALARAAAR